MIQEEKESARLKKEEMQLKLESQRLQNERTRVENEIRRQKVKRTKPKNRNATIAVVICCIFSASIFVSAAIEAFYEVGKEISEYTPLQVKQAVVGYGNATKHQVQDMTRRLLHLTAMPKPDDAADALAIAICHTHHYQTKTRSIKR